MHSLVPFLLHERNEQKKITSPIASQAALIAPLAMPLRKADNRLGHCFNHHPLTLDAKSQCRHIASTEIGVHPIFIRWHCLWSFHAQSVLRHDRAFHFKHRCLADAHIRQDCLSFPRDADCPRPTSAITIPTFVLRHPSSLPTHPYRNRLVHFLFSGGSSPPYPSVFKHGIDY